MYVDEMLSRGRKNMLLTQCDAATANVTFTSLPDGIPMSGLGSTTAAAAIKLLNSVGDSFLRYPPPLLTDGDLSSVCLSKMKNHPLEVALSRCPQVDSYVKHV